MSIPLALGTLSFLLSVIWGGPLIRWLREHKVGKQIRIEEPDLIRAFPAGEGYKSQGIGIGDFKLRPGTKVAAGFNGRLGGDTFP